MKPLQSFLVAFKSNRFFRVAVIFGALFLLLVLVLSPKKSSVPTPSPSSPPRALDTQGRPELEGLEKLELRQSADYRNLIGDRLPIFIENFPTSAGINTTINIYYLESDPASTVRFEIYGLSYLNKDSTPLSNPNIIAFQESYQKGLEEIRSRGMDPKQFLFIYSDIEYIRVTVQEWIDQYARI